MNRYTTNLKDRKKVVEIIKRLENNIDWEVIEYKVLRECKAEGVEDAMECIKELIMDDTLYRSLSVTLGRIK